MATRAFGQKAIWENRSGDAFNLSCRDCSASAGFVMPAAAYPVIEDELCSTSPVYDRSERRIWAPSNEDTFHHRTPLPAAIFGRYADDSRQFVLWAVETRTLCFDPRQLYADGVLRLEMRSPKKDAGPQCAQRYKMRLSRLAFLGTFDRGGIRCQARAPGHNCCHGDGAGPDGVGGEADRTPNYHATARHRVRSPRGRFFGASGHSLCFEFIFHGR